METKRGFSLIEMLVYISILVFMLVIILEIIISITQKDRIIESKRNIENSAALTLERVTREVRESTAISVPSSTRLVLTESDGTIEFYLSDARIFLKENGIDIGALTSSSTRVTSLNFIRFASSTSEGVRVLMTLESGTTTDYQMESFYTSAIKRKK